MNNAAAALAGLKALEDEAITAHKRVADSLEGCRLLIHGATVERYGKIYRITHLRADRGVVLAYGVRVYDKKVGVRDYDLGAFRECKVIKYPEHGDAQSTNRLRSNNAMV